MGLHVGDVVETATGNVISIDELIGKLSNVSIVYVGEMHTSEEDHKVQLEDPRKTLSGGAMRRTGNGDVPGRRRNQFWTVISGEK